MQVITIESPSILLLGNILKDFIAENKIEPNDIFCVSHTCDAGKHATLFVYSGEAPGTLKEYDERCTVHGLKEVEAVTPAAVDKKE